MYTDLDKGIMLYNSNNNNHHGMFCKKEGEKCSPHMVRYFIITPSKQWGKCTKM